mgnify:CR=1 FL=1
MPIDLIALGAALMAGLPVEGGGVTVNRLCGSGMAASAPTTRASSVTPGVGEAVAISWGSACVSAASARSSLPAMTGSAITTTSSMTSAKERPGSHPGRPPERGAPGDPISCHTPTHTCESCPALACPINGISRRRSATSRSSRASAARQRSHSRA